MAFLMFVITTILTLGIIFCLIGITILKLNHFQTIKKNWPNLNSAQLLMRHQRIINHRMNRSIKNVYQNYTRLIMKGLMLITLGISLGGILIGSFNLFLIPLIILGIELAGNYFSRPALDQDINQFYKEYIRTNLDNDLKVVIIPEPILNSLSKLEMILGWIFLLESMAIGVILLELNQIIK